MSWQKDKLVRFLRPALIAAALGLAPFAFAPPAHAGIILVRGEMRTAVTTTDARVIHVPEGVRRLRVLLPIYPSFTAGPNQQQVLKWTTTFSLKPAAQRTLSDRYGNRYEEVIWLAPPVGEIREQTTANLALSLHAATIGAIPPYPLPSSTLPVAVRPYLQPTSLVQSDDPQIRAIAAQFAHRRDLHTEAAVVNAAVSWVVDHLHYSPDHEQYDAVSTLRRGSGECMGYSHLALALLRALGIPARFAAGLCFQEPYSVAGKGSIFAMDGETLSGYLYHAWIQVYFPGEGWVEYDPQGDFGLVDTRRVLFAVAPDKAELPEGRSVTAFEAIADRDDFTEDSHATVTIQTDFYNLAGKRVLTGGPTRQGVYLAGFPDEAAPADHHSADH